MILTEQSALQRAEASRLLMHMFDISTGESNGTVERIVECIVGAALCEVAAMMEDE